MYPMYLRKLLSCYGTRDFNGADYFIKNYLRSLLNNIVIPILMVRTRLEPASH